MKLGHPYRSSWNPRALRKFPSWTKLVPGRDRYGRRQWYYMLDGDIVLRPVEPDQMVPPPWVEHPYYVRMPVPLKLGV